MQLGWDGEQQWKGGKYHGVEIKRRLSQFCEHLLRAWYVEGSLLGKVREKRRHTNTYENGLCL